MSYFVPRAVWRACTPATFHENLGLQILRFTWPRENWQKTQSSEKTALTTLPFGSACSKPLRLDYAIGLDGGGVYVGVTEAFKDSFL